MFVFDIIRDVIVRPDSLFWLHARNKLVQISQVKMVLVL